MSADGDTVDTPDEYDDVLELRSGRVFIPADDTPLEEGDVVVAAARRGVLSKVRRYLKGQSARRR